MINENQVFPLLLEVAPSFKSKWDEFLIQSNEEFDEEEDTEKERYNYYQCIASFARHIISLYKKKKVEEIQEIFKVVEHVILNSDDQTQEMLIVGLLEDIQNFSEREDVGGLRIEPFLLPETKFWWNKVYAFWEKGEPIIDDREK